MPGRRGRSRVAFSNNEDGQQDSGQIAGSSDSTTHMRQEIVTLRNALENLQTTLASRNPTAVDSNQHVRSSHLKTSDIRIPKYGGAHEEKTPYDFLQELEKYRRAVGYSEQDMLSRVIPLALEDDAHSWYLFIGNKCNTWNSFKFSFRREFQPPNYDDALRRELEDRNQGCHESLTGFIRVINDYYDRLESDTGEAERITRIIKQMHPEYRAKLLTVGKSYNTMEELIEEAYSAQANIKLDRSYREPKTFSNIEPALAYKFPKHVTKNYKKPNTQVQALERGEHSGPVGTYGNRYGPKPLQLSSFDPHAHYHGYHGFPNKQWIRGQSKSGGNESESVKSFTQIGNNRGSNDRFGASQKSYGKSGYDSNSNGKRKRSDSEIGPCYSCNEMGHLKRNCPGRNKRPKDSGNGANPSQ